MSTQHRIVFYTTRPGPTETLIDRLMKRGLSVDRHPRPGGFRVVALGEIEEPDLADIIDGLEATVEEFTEVGEG